MICKTKLFAATLLGLVSTLSLSAQQIDKPTIEGKSSFAVICDSKTYTNCQPQIELYKQTIESEGLPVYVISHAWQRPEDVKAELQKLYKEANLEGCVFIGDVPIAMVTKAQHLTSAFKMDERRFPLRDCSVPTDRYYDDFDLVFDRIEEEPVDGLLHYFRMSPTSPQYIDCDIYSARIKPQKSNGDPYVQISRYLEKAVREHKSGNEFDEFVSYTGHGSYSNSLVAWRSEPQILKEQFGDTFEKGNNAKFIRYSMEPYMKYDAIRELRRPELDFMVFHQHGDYFRMYISGSPTTYSADEHKEQMETYLRSRFLRSPESVRKTADKWGLDSTWYANAADENMVRLDSIIELREGIILEEINQIRPNARMVIFDACYNGDFREDDYIAGKFIFADGRCCVSWANSVNVLQDKSAFDLLGLLGKGARVGTWAKHINILESHISGDPTFFFHSPDAEKYNISVNDLNTDNNYWLEQLKSDLPDMRCLALIHLYEQDYPQIKTLLLEQFKSSPYAVVRHTAFRLSESLGGEEFKQVLKLSVSDEFEFLRRIGVTRMGRVGDDDFIPMLVDSYITDNNSARIVFQSGLALGSFHRDKVKAAIEKRLDGAKFHNAERYKKELLDCIELETAENGMPQDLFNISKEGDPKWRLSYVSYMKNRPLNQYIPEMAAMLADETETDKFRIRLAEALAWFNLSADKQIIADTCKKLLDKGNMSEELTREVQRAYSRITSKK